MTRVLLRNPDLIVRNVDDQLFLIDERRGKIHHLNETASAIWRLLDVPHTANEVINTFRFLFPEEDARQMKQALRSSLHNLVDTTVLLRRRVS